MVPHLTGKCDGNLSVWRNECLSEAYTGKMCCNCVYFAIRLDVTYPKYAYICKFYIKMTFCIWWQHMHACDNINGCAARCKMCLHCKVCARCSSIYMYGTPTILLLLHYFNGAATRVHHFQFPFWFFYMWLYNTVEFCTLFGRYYNNIIKYGWPYWVYLILFHVVHVKIPQISGEDNMQLDKAA